ncbi:hypothetical protein BDL97_13G128300 [Sphagnum fallax]|nr:hypothetical protein BDL97_13G128300 [Sphagnum fallax]
MMSSNVDASRVTLRRFSAADLPDFMEWATDDNVTKTLVWDSYESQEQGLKFLNSVAIPHPWLKAICVDGRAVGSISLEKGQCMMDSCRATLGYCIAKKYWGQGIMTIAVKLALSTGFQDLDVMRIEALVQLSNSASRRVLEKAGFQLEGTLLKYIVIKGQVRDCFLFAAFRPAC